MTKSELIRLKKIVARKTGFHEDKKTTWAVEVAPNIFRSLIVHGQIKDKSAAMKISDRSYLDDIKNYRRYQRKSENISGAVKIPAILKSGTVGNSAYSVQSESGSAGRLIEAISDANELEKIKIARLYWRTADAFRDFGPVDASTSEYFISHMAGWLEINARDAKGWGRPSVEMFDRVVRIIFTESVSIRMEWFFNRFQNWDLTDEPQGVAIWDVTIDRRPEAWGIASWLWGLAIHCWDQTPIVCYNTMNSWTMYFEQEAPAELRPRLRRLVVINTLERLLATLLVDIPLKRSPFSGLSKRDLAKAHSFVTNVLMLFVSDVEHR